MKLRGVRREMFRTMTASLNVPQATAWVEVDVTGTVDLLATLRDRREFHGLRVSPLLIVAKAACLAIERVAAGLRHLSEEVTSIMDPPVRSRAGVGTAPGPTKREKEIIRMIANERSTLQIAESLGLSPATVETHRKNILHKLGFHNATGLVRYALERGWMVN